MLAASIDALVVPSAGNQGDMIAMSAQASSTIEGAALTYTWDFGDGTQQSGVDLTDVSHAYAVPSPSGNPYAVTLTVSDGDQPATAVSSLTIDDVPPIISAGPSQTVHAGDTAQFTGSASDTGGPGQIASIQWDFNYNGNTFNPDASADGELTPSSIYATPGTYVVAMQATDQSGAVSQDFTTVLVKPADALIVNAGADLTVTAGQNVALSGSYSDPSGTVSASGIAWDTNYNGSTFNPTVTGTLTPTVSFSTPGTYQVALQITDSTGASDLSIFNVTVDPVSYTGPTADAGTDQTINEGDTVSFNGSYTDPDGTVSSGGIAWDFNYDGVSFNPQATGSLTPNYQFTMPGDYTVALQITDSNGMTSLSTLDVTVNAVPPTVSAGTNLTVTAGQLTQFAGSASVPSGANDPLSYAWDFNYDGSNFNPGSADTLNPYNVFVTPGTYTVALQATDSEGVSSLSTITVTVNPSSSLVVNAGPDQALNEGDTASFAASYSDASGTIDPNTAQWDFNYDGQNFVANPSANGTLTPSYQFTTPGVYLVAVKLTDSNGVSSIGVQYVSVADVAPAVDAGTDQTVNQGATVQFAGTASVPSGANDALTYAWDFDYDGNNFVAAPNSNTLTPTYVYSTPGTYEAALQVTDAYGQVSLETVTITVNDVPPTATVTNSGPANAGSPVTFTISNLQDQTPGDTPTYLVDWDGSGQFEELTPDELTTNQDGSISFTHSYDVPGNYNAVVRIMDGSGGYTDYTTNVVVNGVAPTAGYFGPSHTNVIDPTVPIVFQNVTDPSLSDTLAGFTYYVSLDGGAYTSSTSPYYYLPSNISSNSHTVKGYVEDSAGQTSPVYTSSFFVTTVQTLIDNGGTGKVEVDWTGASAPVMVSANSSYFISGPVSGLTITLLTSGATYDLDVNNSIAQINAAAGVQNVNLTVITYSDLEETGTGDIGEIDLPSDSTLSVNARGDLGSIVGPSSDGTLTGCTATDLVFANLTGSITGLDFIGMLQAGYSSPTDGWLGTSASQVIDVAAGIGSLSAYGVGATVIADARQDASDPVMSVTVGDGGVPGEIDGGNVGNVQIAGDVNVFKAQNLMGNFDPPSAIMIEVNKENVNTLDDLGSVDLLLFSGDSPEKAAKIKATGTINTLDIKNSLSVTGNIQANSIGEIIGGSLAAQRIIAPGGIGKIDLKQDLSLIVSQDKNKITAGTIETKNGSITSIEVGGNLTAIIEEGNGTGTAIEVAGNFVGIVNGGKGQTGPISVHGNFMLPQNSVILVSAAGAIGDISVDGDIGGSASEITLGSILGKSIGTIQSGEGIFLSNIRTTGGDIGAILAPKGDLKAAVEAKGGNIGMVSAKEVDGNLTASASDPTNSNTGGSIFEVDSAKAIPDITIRAQYFIGRIIVTNAAKAVEKFKVFAAGGIGGFSQNTLIINVEKGTFRGVVSLGVPANPKVQAPTYKNGDVLFILAQNNNQTTQWTVQGPAGATTAVNVEFAPLTGDKFGFVKKSLRLSNPNFSINGTSGDKAD